MGTFDTGRGLIFRAGACFGAVGRMFSTTTKSVPARLGRRGSELEGLRASLFRGLLQACKINTEEGEGIDAGGSIDNAIENAEGIRQIIFEGRPEFRHRVIDIHRIGRVNRNLCHTIDERALKKNQYSIEKFGLRNPPTVRKVERDLELVGGRLRYEACRRAGVTEIAVMVKELGDSEAAEIALLDPLSRNGQDHVDPEWLDSVLRFYNAMRD